MTSKKLNSTTALVVALSFLQPQAGLAQTKTETSAPVPAEALDAALTCVQDFKGNPKDAEKACLEELNLAGITCDPVLLPPEDAPADKPKGKGKDKGKDGSPEMIAERIVRAANGEACAADQAKAAADEAKAAADAKAQAEEEAQAAADAKAAADKKAQEADAEAKAQADADAQAAAEAKIAADLKAREAAKAEAEAQAKAEAEAAALAEREARAKDKAKAEKADAKAARKAARTEAEADSKAATETTQTQTVIAGEDKAQTDAEARTQADAGSETDTQVNADAEAQVQAQAQEQKAAETAASEAAARAEEQSPDCVVDLIDASGTTVCADDMSQEEIAAVTAAAEDSSDVEVSTQTVTEESTRSSDEEFAAEPKAEAKDSGGLSNLEKAGLFALGAVTIGSLLKNGEKVTAKTGDRVVVEDKYGNYSVLKDDDVLVRQPGDTVRTETFSDGSTRSIVTREDGVKIVTIRDSLGHVLRRTRVDTDGHEVVLIDDTRDYEPVEVSKLPQPDTTELAYQNATDEAALRAALRAAENRDLGRSFSLSQVRNYREVRALAPEVNLDNITFATDSAAIQPSQAEQLREIGLLMEDFIAENPREVFLIEGYTDAVGDESYNLLLSDRRAETVALALTEYFGVRPENLVVQGYGERFPLVPTLEAERQNRRVAVRRITTLIQPR